MQRDGGDGTSPTRRKEPGFPWMRLPCRLVNHHFEKNGKGNGQYTDALM